MGALTPLLWLKQLASWLFAADIEDARPGGAIPQNPIPPRGNIVSSEMGVDLGHDAEAQFTFETDAGLSTVRNRVSTCCGRFVYTPYARCGWCGVAICGQEHHFMCSKSGCRVGGLCPRCVHWFAGRHESGGIRLPLCPQHAEIAGLTGDIEAGWWG